MVRIKSVRVFDYATDARYLVGKFEESDREWLKKQGWELSNKLTLLIWVSGPSVGVSLSEFWYAENDLYKYGSGMGISHTSVVLANVMKKLNFEYIPDEIDVREYCDIGEDCGCNCKRYRETK